MADQTVQIGFSGTPVRVDVSELIRPADAVAVERQRLAIGDPDFFANMAKVFADGSLSVKNVDENGLLVQILVELRLHTRLMVQGFGLTANGDFDVEQMRTQELNAETKL